MQVTRKDSFNEREEVSFKEKLVDKEWKKGVLSDWLKNRSFNIELKIRGCYDATAAL